jgi:hypothetical protein
MPAAVWTAPLRLVLAVAVLGALALVSTPAAGAASIHDRSGAFTSVVQLRTRCQAARIDDGAPTLARPDGGARVYDRSANVSQLRTSPFVRVLATEGGGDAFYRYVSDGEAQAAQNGGSIPNTDVAGNLRSVFYSTDRYESASEAESALQIGAENPAGATASPTWRLAASGAGADWSYGGNVDGGSGVELLTENALRLLGAERLGP